MTGTLQRPYRFAEWVDVTVRYPDSAEQVLPASSAPAVRALRDTRRADLDSYAGS